MHYPAASGATSNFQKYSAYYDLLYRDKDYAEETKYVAQIIRSAEPKAGTILELGSGTGRHGRLLAAMGFKVHGIERSPDMVVMANLSPASLSSKAGGSFTYEVGDARSVNLGRTFDAVVALFHVISYQTTNEDLQAVFRVAAQHLAPGGVFLFDVWHGPAVLTERPKERVKNVANDCFEVSRTARPELDSKRNTVRVTYEMECRDRQSGDVVRFSEEHLMRYLFPAEIDLLARCCGMRVLTTEEFLTGRPPSPSSWSVAYLLQR
jgi:SAM-dependent methyltransferase